MKKQIKRLSIKGETIRSLSPAALAEVIGGIKTSSAPDDPCNQPASPYVSCMGSCAGSCGTCDTCNGCTLVTF